MIAAGLAVAGSLCGGEDRAGAAAEKAKAAVKATAVDAAAEMQKAKDDFKNQTDAILAERQKLIDQMKGATEEQKKAIKAKLEEQMKHFADAMRELGRQQRDEARKMRENTARPGGR